jgi:glycosyltransferase involved in cell wall biosynthesis
MPSSDLIVLSHLRWTGVWQRPHHLISRLAERRGRTWFVEEPERADVDRPRLRTERRDAVTRVWLEVPAGGEGHLYFDAPEAAGYAAQLLDVVGPYQQARDVWLYTPSALPLAEALGPRLLVYDVMDDLASFAGAPPQLQLHQRQALRRADLVFAGGRSLHRMAEQSRPDAHLFPSGVDVGHLARARSFRRGATRPVAGYVGVIDERVDLDLVAALSQAMPDWELRMVGPLAKIGPADLPAAPNLVYPGAVRYEDLPETLGGFDVALMPFALNEATKAISPTKTLEYLAAGLPVVSTRIRDVVDGFTGVVDFADDAQGFAEACRQVGDRAGVEHAGAVRDLLAQHGWDGITGRMAELMAAAAARDERVEVRAG